MCICTENLQLLHRYSQILKKNYLNLEIGCGFNFKNFVLIINLSSWKLSNQKSFYMYDMSNIFFSDVNIRNNTFE